MWIDSCRLLCYSRRYHSESEHVSSKVVYSFIADSVDFFETNVTKTSIVSSTMMHSYAEGWQQLKTDLSPESFLEGKIFYDTCKGREETWTEMGNVQWSVEPCVAFWRVGTLTITLTLNLTLTKTKNYLQSNLFLTQTSARAQESHVKSWHPILTSMTNGFLFINVMIVFSNGVISTFDWRIKCTFP